MAHTHILNRVHCIFSTKERRSFFAPELQPRLWSYISGIARNLDVEVLAVNGSHDHAHVFIVLPAKFALSEVMQKLKANSSRWLSQDVGLRGFSWQEGYAAFSVSMSQTNSTIAYIRSQSEHHRRRSYADEFRRILELNGAITRH